MPRIASPQAEIDDGSTGIGRAGYSIRNINIGEPASIQRRLDTSRARSGTVGAQCQNIRIVSNAGHSGLVEGTGSHQRNMGAVVVDFLSVAGARYIS